jgi:hypothetical protein
MTLTKAEHDNIDCVFEYGKKAANAAKISAEYSLNKKEELYSDSESESDSDCDEDHHE